MNKRFLCLLLSAIAIGAYAEKRTVATAVELVAALQALNSKTAPAESNIIYLEPGSYDVSRFAMKYWNGNGENSTSVKHLALANVTVSGRTPNPRDTVIYGNYTDGIIHSYASSLKNLTVSNGYEAVNSINEDRAGGVCSTGTGSVHSNVIVTCCYSAAIGGGVESGKWYDSTIISNKTAVHGGGVRGGAFYNCNIVSNVAVKTGGGAYYGTTLSNCCIIGNQALDGGGAGSTDSNDAICHIYGGLIVGNTATSSGGGAYGANFYGGTLVSNNVATYGGGMRCNARNVASNIVICCNKAQYGGGTYGGNLVKCEIRDNLATSDGGGCYSSTGEECTIMGNVALYRGGGTRSGTFTDCLIACNSATNGATSVYGGGIDSTLARRCVISNNIAQAATAVGDRGSYGAGAYYSRVFDSIIIHNLNKDASKNVYGGGMYDGCASNTLITGNACYPNSTSGKNIQGGGVYAANITNCVVINNCAAIGTGMNGGTAYGCIISNNVGRSAASAYSVRQVKMVEKCEIVGRATVFNGPAIDCRFVNFTNGVYIAPGENIMVSGYFSGIGSTSTELIDYSLWATNCLIANNVTKGYLFAALGARNTILMNCTVADNVADRMFNNATNNANVVAVNTIFVGNRKADGTPINMLYNTAHNNIKLTNCLIGPGRQTAAAPTYEANTITNDSAHFVGGDGPDRYAIRYGSPARGKGAVMDWMTDALDIRQDPAFPRLRDGAVDIGCYQCWLDPVGLTFRIR